MDANQLALASWAWGMSLIVLTIAVHAIGVVIMALVMVRIRVETERRRPGLGRVIPIVIGVVASVGLLLAVLHGIEAVIWAAAYVWLGLFSTISDAMLYSIGAMTKRPYWARSRRAVSGRDWPRAD